MTAHHAAVLGELKTPGRSVWVSASALVAVRAGPGQTRQRGVALVVALLIVAIAVASVVPMASRERSQVARVAAGVDLAQARYIGRGAEAWVGRVLARDSRDNEVDHLGEAWATPIPGMAVERGVMSGALIDLQGRFNINSLVDQGVVNPLQRSRFERLLRHLELDPAIAAAAVDWIDGNDVIDLAGGAESAVYLRLSPPYRAANAPLVSVSELRLLAGVDAAAFARLEGLVTALPESAGINVNTAPAEVLLALGPAVGEQAVQTFLRGRVTTPLQSEKDMREEAFLNQPGMELDGLVLGSRWFRLDASISLPRAVLDHHAILTRGGDGVRVYRRWTGSE